MKRHLTRGRERAEVFLQAVLDVRVHVGRLLFDTSSAEHATETLSSERTVRRGYELVHDRVHVVYGNASHDEPFLPSARHFYFDSRIVIRGR